MIIVMVVDPFLIEIEDPLIKGIEIGSKYGAHGGGWRILF